MSSGTCQIRCEHIRLHPYATPARTAAAMLEILARNQARFQLASEGLPAFKNRLIQAFGVKNADNTTSTILVFPDGNPDSLKMRAFKTNGSLWKIDEINVEEILSMEKSKQRFGATFELAPGFKDRVNCIVLLSSFQSSSDLWGMMRSFKSGIVMGNNLEHGEPTFEGSGYFVLEDAFKGRKGDNKERVSLNAYVLSFPAKSE